MYRYTWDVDRKTWTECRTNLIDRLPSTEVGMRGVCEQHFNCIYNLLSFFNLLS